MNKKHQLITELFEKHSKQLIEDLISMESESEKKQVAEMPQAAVQNPKRYVYGIAGIAQLFGCSIPTAQRIKSSGVIDAAISQCGQIIVTDADMALDLLRLNNSKWGRKCS